MSEVHEGPLVPLELTDKQSLFLQALDLNKGNVSAACRAVGIHRTTFYDWSNSSDRFKEEAEIVREETIDWVEGKLIQAIDKDSLTAIMFYMSNIGWRRGYGKMFEHFMANKPEESEEDSELTTYLKRGQQRVERLKRSDVVSEQ